MKKTIYFITGVCGVGKTSIIPFLKKTLSSQFVVHDFDEEGVPNGADREWRLAQTRQWIAKGTKNAKGAKITVICGFSRPSEIQKMKNTLVGIGFVLLDANKSVIKKRLQQRYKSKESRAKLKRVSGDSLSAFIKDNTEFSKVLRREFEKFYLPIIDTSLITPKTVSEQVAQLISS